MPDDSPFLSIPLKGGSASAILRVENPSVLEANNLDVGFWVVLDDGPVEKSIGLIGHGRGRLPRKGWKTRRLGNHPVGPRHRTYDAECLGRDGSMVYVVGSQFGPKKGPLSPRRAFLARFDEAAVEGKLKKSDVPLEIVHRPFALHRLINDALRASQLEAIPLGPSGRRAYIEATLRRAAKKDRAWVGDVRVEDWPINLECIEFTPDGVLLGLRYPCTAEGHPIVVRVDSLEPLFHPDATPPRAEEVWVLEEVGQREHAAGLRGMERVGEAMHVLSGPIASPGRTRTLLDDYPGARNTRCVHWVLDADGSAEVVRKFRRRERLEGMAHLPDGRWCYVVEDRGDRELRIYAE